MRQRRKRRFFTAAESAEIWDRWHPRRPPELSFGELSDQFLAVTEQDCSVNGTNRKWLDKQRANLTLLREIIGSETSVHQVDYDACLKVRTMLSRLPKNRNKLYEGLPVTEAIIRGEDDDKPKLSSVTQAEYLQTLKRLLDLATRKRLIPANAAEYLKPVKRDAVHASEKRLPFAPEQLNKFFSESAPYKSSCQQGGAGGSGCPSCAFSWGCGLMRLVR